MLPQPRLAPVWVVIVMLALAIPFATAQATPTPTPTATSTPVAAVKLYGVEGTTVYEINLDALTIVPLAPALPFTVMTIATIDPGAIYVSTFDNNTIEYQLHRYRPGIGTTLIGAMSVGGTCANKPCWKADTKKAKYNDKELTPDGVQKLQLKPSLVNGKAKALLKGKGARLDLPALPIPLASLPLTVQLKNSDGECWTATYSTFKKNQSDQFKAKAD